MHFREVNKKLKQLKTNLYWASESLNGLECSSPFYGARLRDYQQALDALYKFRNTEISLINQLDYTLIIKHKE